MSDIKCSKELVVDTWGFPHDADETLGAKVIEDKVTGTGRWHARHRLIVTLPGQEGLFMTYYESGLTENQSTYPWEHLDVITFTPVEEYEKIVKDYRVKT